MRFVRVAWRLPVTSLVIVGSLVALALTQGVTWISATRGRALQDRVLRRSAIAVGKMIGMRLTCRGTPPSGAFVLVTNHLSYVDIIALMRRLDARFLSKAEVARWPLIGAVTRLAGTLYVDRTRRGDLPRVIAEIDRTLATNHGVVFFPEGTSSPGVEVLPFKPSLFEPACRNGTRVSCAALHHRAPPGERPAQWSVCWWGGMDFTRHILGLLALPYFETTIVFGEESVHGDDRKQLAEAAHRAVRRCFTPVCDAASIEAAEDSTKR